MNWELTLKDLLRRDKLILLSLSLLIFISNIGYGIDNIEVYQNQINSKKGIDSIIDLAWTLVGHDIQGFQAYGKRGLFHSKKIKYLKGKCESTQIIGTYFFLTGSLDSASVWYDKSLKYRFEYGDSALISGTLNNMANVFEKQGKYFKAIKQYNTAKKYLPKINKKKNARLNSNLSAIYIRIGNYSKALYYNKMAYEILQKSSTETKELGNCLFNEGNVYDLMNDYDNALDYYYRAKEIYGNLKDDFNIAKVYTNIGSIYLNKGELDFAIQKYKSAKKIFLTQSSLSGLAGIEQNLGIAYKLKGNFNNSLESYKNSYSKWNSLGNKQKKAEVLIKIGDLYLSMGYLNKAKKAFNKAKQHIAFNPHLKSDLYYGLSKTYERLSEYKKAIPYYILFMNIKDSLNRESIKWKNLEAQYIETQNKIKLLEKEKIVILEKNKREVILRFSLIGGFLLVVLFFFALYKSLRANQRRKEAENTTIQKQREIESLLKDQELISIRNILEVQDKERKRIAQDLHDRLGSTLSMVKLHFHKSNENIQKLKIENKKEYEKANSLLDDACNEVRRIAHNLSSGVLKNFGLVSAIEELKNSLVNSGQYEVEFITHRFDKRLPKEYELSIYSLIQELVSNIIRHAKASQISIQLLKKEKQLNIEVTDNGKGFDVTINDNKGMGFKNIQSRLLQFKGKMNIDSQPGNGTTVFIEIPLNI